METAPSEPRIRVGPQHQVIDNPQQPDIYVRIDRGKRTSVLRNAELKELKSKGKFVGLHTRGESDGLERSAYLLSSLHGGLSLPVKHSIVLTSEISVGEKWIIWLWWRWICFLFSVFCVTVARNKNEKLSHERARSDGKGDDSRMEKSLLSDFLPSAHHQPSIERPSEASRESWRGTSRLIISDVWLCQRSLNDLNWLFWVIVVSAWLQAMWSHSYQVVQHEIKSWYLSNVESSSLAHLSDSELFIWKMSRSTSNTSRKVVWFEFMSNSEFIH